MPDNGGRQREERRGLFDSLTDWIFGDDDEEKPKPRQRAKAEDKDEEPERDNPTSDLSAAGAARTLRDRRRMLEEL